MTAVTPLPGALPSALPGTTPRIIDPIDALTGATAAGSAGSLRERWPARRVLRWATVIGLLALLVVEGTLVTPYIVKASDALTEPNPWWLLLALGAEACSMGAFARVQRRMLSAAGQRVSICPMVSLTYAANALSVTFPGGTALSSGYVFKRLRTWGATVPAAGFTVVASGILSLVGFAVLAIFTGLWAGDNLVSSLLIVAAAAAAAVGAVFVSRRHPSDLLERVLVRGLGRVNRVVRREPTAGRDAVERFVHDLTAIHPRHRDWAAGLAFAVLNWAADLVCLIACCEAVGASRASMALVMVAYIAGMSASSISFLPGGFGIVDAAMIFALTSGGVSTATATAGVVLYRLISFLLVVALGWVAWTGSWIADRRRASLDSDDTVVEVEVEVEVEAEADGVAVEAEADGVAAATPRVPDYVVFPPGSPAVPELADQSA